MLYGGFTDGYIYSPTLNRETGEWRQVFVKVTQLQMLEDHIRKSSTTLDVYVAPSIFSEPKATKQFFKASNVCYTEFDGNAPETFDIDPTAIIQSSSDKHTHCYWLLDTPIIDYKELEQINRGITFSHHADASSWDCTQILRPPESTNHKRGTLVSVTASTETVYNIGEFAIYSAPAQIEEDSILLAQVPDVTDVIFKYAFSEEFRQVFSSTPTEGSRSSAMMRVGYIAAETGCTNEEIYALIRNFDDRIRKYSDRKDRHRRLLDIIERVRTKYPLVTSTEGPSFDTIEILDIISFGNQTLEVDWCIPQLLQEGGNLVLCGPPGVGKTQVALNFAYGLATGRPVLDYKMGNPRKVLFISCEMGPVDLKVFTDPMTARHSDKELALLSENFFVYPHGEPLYLNTKTGQDQLLRMIHVLKVDGFIFDSLGSATQKALTDEEATKNLLDFNDRLRKEMGVFSWFIHHNRKATENNREPSGLADVYGSQYITARATTVISLWPVQRNIIKVRELKKRLAPQADDWYITRTATGLNFRQATATEINAVPKKTTIGKASNDPFNI